MTDTTSAPIIRRSGRTLTNRKREATDHIIWSASENDMRVLKRIKNHYRFRILGQPVSTSLVMRHALYDLLGTLSLSMETSEGINDEAAAIRAVRDY